MNQKPSALPDAAQWLASLFTGTLGSLIAVLAIAGFGFVLLQGRLGMRHGIRVVLGCFILFGAPAIARSLAALANLTSSAAPMPGSNTAPPPFTPPPEPPQTGSDPYAGASLPM